MKRPQSGKRCSRAAPLHGRQTTAALWGRNITPPAPGSGSGRHGAEGIGQPLPPGRRRGLHGDLPLEQHGQGVWSVYLPGDQHGHYYTFTVEVDGTAYETGDPYARTAGVNGLRSMILDAPRIDPPDWNHDHRVIVPASRRTVWEVSVRDFSQDPACGVRNAWRGKFMAFTQKGTTLSSAGTFPTCLDYLKRLGVGYVQLMPIFDFGSVDESRPLTRQYNWGYDPTNYNVPEAATPPTPRKAKSGCGNARR